MMEAPLAERWWRVVYLNERIENLSRDVENCSYRRISWSLNPKGTPPPHLERDSRIDRITGTIFDRKISGEREQPRWYIRFIGRVYQKIPWNRLDSFEYKPFYLLSTDRSVSLEEARLIFAPLDIIEKLRVESDDCSTSNEPMRWWKMSDYACVA